MVEGRLRTLVLLMVFVAPALAGCLRVHTSISVSPADQVSGEILPPRSNPATTIAGPQFDENINFSQKISVSPTRSTVTRGSRPASPTWTFAEVPQLASLSRDATGVIRCAGPATWSFLRDGST